MNIASDGPQLTRIGRQVIVGPNGVRAGWRFVIFYLIWSILDHFKNLVVWDHFLRYTNHPLWHPLDFLVWDGPEFIVTLAAAYLMMKFVERGRWPYRNYGLGLQSKSLPVFLEGLIWGFLTPTVLILLLYIVGAVSFEGFALSGRLLLQFALFWFFAMVLDGLHDQFLFRGYPLFTFATGMGFWPASILLSVLFGGLLPGLFDPSFRAAMSGGMRTATLVDLLSASLLFLFYCLTFRRTGSLWFAVGFHAMFAYAALVLYGSPSIGNKGQSVDGHLLSLRFHGSNWLTGGPFGIEASILFLPLLVALFLIFDRRHKHAVFIPECSSNNSER